MLNLFASYGAYVIAVLFVLVFIITYFTHASEFRKKVGDNLATMISTFVGVAVALQIASYNRVLENRDKLQGFLLGSLYELSRHHVAAIERRDFVTKDGDLSPMKAASLPFTEQMLKSEIVARELPPFAYSRMLNVYANVEWFRRDGLSALGQSDDPLEEKLKEYFQRYDGYVTDLFKFICVQEKETEGLLPVGSVYHYLIKEYFWTGDKLKEIGCDDVAKYYL
jgi:hypothetical protein